VESAHLYQEIAESIRQEILYGALQAQDELPTVREMAERWGCAPGTVQRAYRELARQGLVVAHPGRGTRVASAGPGIDQLPLRRAMLMNRTESFLLTALSAGHSPDEVERAFQLSLDRWRTHEPGIEQHQSHSRFVGSHDPAVALLKQILAQRDPQIDLELSFAGSLGGLMALAQGEADVAGAHLWDAETDSYNAPFVRRLFPGRKMALLTMAHRRLGILTAAGNPLQIHSLEDVRSRRVRWIQRQRGAGTRVWLQAQCRDRNLQLNAEQIDPQEALTHSELAARLAEGAADAGLGIETAALAYGLDFILLTTECYHLILPETGLKSMLGEAITDVLQASTFREALHAMGGYEVNNTGHLDWVE